jgi:hypothetical protein
MLKELRSFMPVKSGTESSGRNQSMNVSASAAATVASCRIAVVAEEFSGGDDNWF